MRIAILTPTLLPFSGIDRLVEKEAERLSKGNSVDVFALRAEMKLKNAKVVEMGMPQNSFLERAYRLFYFLDFIKIIRYTRRMKKYDKIICHQYPMTIYGSLAKKMYGKEYIYHDAGIAYPHLFESVLERAYMRLFSLFTAMSIKNADGAISISNFLKNELKRDAGIESTVEYIEVDRKRFNKNIDGRNIRAKYKIKSGPLLLYVGRISPHKGIHLLIEAFGMIKKRIPEAKLVIVGKNTFNAYSERLKNLAKSSNLGESVLFAGFVKDDELPQYYAACDAYTTATLWEGFDLPAVEAQCCGKPVVAFNLCSHPEVVKNGVLVKPGDTREFAEAVIGILKKRK